MSKIKDGGLDQYGAEPFEQQQFGTAGVKGVKTNESRSGSSNFCVQSGFASSGSLHVRLQASVNSGYDLCHPILVPKFDLSI